MAGTPTIRDLMDAVTNVNDWNMLGQGLNMPQAVLGEIHLSYHIYGIPRMKTEMFSRWLARDPEASWIKVEAALRRMEHNTEADGVRERYLGGASTGGAGGNPHENPLFPMEWIDELAKKVEPLKVPSQEEQKQAIKEFAANEVEVVIQTCNKAEYYAALEKVEPPQIEGIEKPVEYPHSQYKIVVGTFAGKNAAVAWTEQGSYSQEDLEGILAFFEKATILLGLGVCMGIKHEYADVIVSKKINAAVAPKIGNDGIEPRGETKLAGKSVTKVFCDTAGWNEFVCTTVDQRVAKAYAGFVFSSPNLINNHAIKHSLLQQGYIGGEMEGWVLFKMQEKIPTY